MTRQDFYRDRAIKASVLRSIYLAHTAGAERRDDFVGSELRARGQGPCVGATIACAARYRDVAPTLGGVGNSYRGITLGSPVIREESQNTFGCGAADGRDAKRRVQLFPG
jgi:hypothetical protein